MSTPAGSLSLDVYISGYKPVPSFVPDWPESWQATWPATSTRACDQRHPPGTCCQRGCWSGRGQGLIWPILLVP
jgi:hypothetical protein